MDATPAANRPIEERDFVRKRARERGMHRDASNKNVLRAENANNVVSHVGSTFRQRCTARSGGRRRERASV